MFRIVCLTLAIGLLSGGLRAAPLDSPELAAVIGQQLAKTGTPSVSLAVIRNGKIVLTRAYGAQSSGIPASPETLYNIASLSKPLSAEVMLRLASQGRIDLDEPMSAYWLDPDLASDPRAGKLTPRLALSHRTGFPNWRSKTTGLKFIREPGTYGYSGEGYVYLARYAAKRSGVPFETLAETLVLKPAGMTNTSYTQRPWFARRIATPTDAKGAALTPNIATTANPADLVYTTAGDYALFMIQVMNGTGLSPAIARDRLTVEADMKPETCKNLSPAQCPDAIGLGLGWQVIDLGPRRYLMHTGRDDGVSTFAYLSPTNRTGLVVLTNGENGISMVTPILRALKLDPKFTALLEAMSK